MNRNRWWAWPTALITGALAVIMMATPPTAAAMAVNNEDLVKKANNAEPTLVVHNVEIVVMNEDGEIVPVAHIDILERVVVNRAGATTTQIANANIKGSDAVPALANTANMFWDDGAASSRSQFGITNLVGNNDVTGTQVQNPTSTQQAGVATNTADTSSQVAVTSVNANPIRVVMANISPQANITANNTRLGGTYSNDTTLASNPATRFNDMANPAVNFLAAARRSAAPTPIAVNLTATN